MELKYIYNEKGERESLVIPIAEWERLRRCVKNEGENKNGTEPVDIRTLFTADETFRKDFLAYADELDRQKRWA